jgi:hypothetical protein
MQLLSGSATGRITCCKLDSTLCIETSKELRTRLAEAVYEEHADQSLTKQLVTCNMDTAYPPIRNKIVYEIVIIWQYFYCGISFASFNLFIFRSFFPH